MKILIVDDSKTMLRIISNTLKRIGHDDNLTAENGQEALELYNNNKFDIILTDWNMPVMDGLAFVKAVRKIDKDTPIVMITTEGGKTSVIDALRAGVNNYIVKPFTPVVLKSKLADILGEND